MGDLSSVCSMAGDSSGVIPVSAAAVSSFILALAGLEQRGL